MSESVRKAFTILHCLAERPEGTQLHELCRACRLNKTTGLRYLTTLVDLNIIYRDGNRYRLGLGLFELGSRVNLTESVRFIAEPILRDLARRTGKTVNLAWLDGNEALYLSQVTGASPVPLRILPGNRLPLYCTALGKSILAVLPAGHLNELLKDISLRSYTPATQTNPALVKRTAAVDHNRGWSVDNEEFARGIFCCAVPLMVASIDFYGSISVSAADADLTAESNSTLRQDLAVTRDTLLVALGSGRA